MGDVGKLRGVQSHQVNQEIPKVEKQLPNFQKIFNNLETFQPIFNSLAKQGEEKIRKRKRNFEDLTENPPLNKKIKGPSSLIPQNRR